MTRLNGIDRVRLGIVCAAIVLGAVAYSAQLTSFLHAKEAVFAACAGLMGVVLLARGRLPMSSVRAYGPLLAVPILSVCAGAAGFVSLSQAMAVEVLRWAVLLVFAIGAFDLLTMEEGRRKTRAAILISGAAASVLALIQYAKLMPDLFPDYGGTANRVYSVFGNPGLLGGYLAVIFPLALHEVLTAPRPRPLLVTGGVLICGGLMISGSRSAWLAAAIGVLVVALMSKGRGRRLMVVGGAICLLGLVVWLLAPELTAGRIRQALSSHDSGRGLRFWFWEGTLRMIRRHPFFGVGLGNYAYWSPSYLAEALWRPGGEHLVHNELHTRHAHCDPLELLAETGVAGSLFLAAWWARLVRRPGPEWGSLAALLVFSLFYFPFYSVPHAAVGLLLGGMLLAPGTPDTCPVSPPARGDRVRAYGAGIIAIPLLPLVIWMVLEPSYRLRAAEDLHVAQKAPFEAYGKATACRWAPAEAHEKFGIALLEAGQAEKAEAEFRRALEGLDTGAVYLGIGTAALLQGDRSAAREALESCVRRWPSYAPAWSLLMRATPAPAQHRVLQSASRWLTEDELSGMRAEFGME